MLEIRNLEASVEGTQILKGINLTINKGEIHAIMGPNGSGKSTLASVLAGRPEYDITGGEVIYKGQDLLEMDPDERARAGLFLAFQYPVEIPGVSVSNFMRTAINARRKESGEKPISGKEFLEDAKKAMDILEMDKSFLNRSINEGFSGGEKKRHEIFQMAMLKPDMGILDETDSGLDIDALQIVANGVKQLHTGNNAFMLVTHYQRILNYINPDRVHVLYDGRIAKSGSKELALKLEAEGYDWIRKDTAVNTG